MVLTAQVKPGKGSQFLPQLQIIKPGGAIATDEDGLKLTQKGATVTGTLTLDTVGWWQVRVRGKNLAEPLAPPVYSAGTYSISVKYSQPKAYPTLPVVSKSFNVTGLIDSKIDTDDYRGLKAAVDELASATSQVADDIIGAAVKRALSQQEGK